MARYSKPAPSAQPLQRLWQQPGWPAMRYDGATVAAAVASTRRAQGVVEGKLAAIGFQLRQTLTAEAWTHDAVSTAAIEGERLDLAAVRSSVARRLGVPLAKARHVPRDVDGLLDLMDDAVTNAGKPLSHERLWSWHAALFPTGFSGLTRIRVGGYREHVEPMQIISGPIGRKTVHYEAPRSADVPREMAQLLAWLEGAHDTDHLVMAALAHLWFETVHPFEDGNGRVGRAIVDLILARDAGPSSRLLRISQQLLTHRGAYYDGLKAAQHGPLDVSDWVRWFVAQIHAACDAASAVIDLSLNKASFWHGHRDKDMNARQRKAINALLDAGPGGFKGGISTRKYENLTGASRATASRDLSALAGLGLLEQSGAGRGTRYQLR